MAPATPRRSPDSRPQPGNALLSSRVRRHILILFVASNKALQTARAQASRLCELRAAVSPAGLLSKQAQHEEAATLLALVYFAGPQRREGDARCIRCSPTELLASEPRSQWRSGIGTEETRQSGRQRVCLLSQCWSMRALCRTAAPDPQRTSTAAVSGRSCAAAYPRHNRPSLQGPSRSCWKG